MKEAAKLGNSEKWNFLRVASINAPSLKDAINLVLKHQKTKQSRADKGEDFSTKLEEYVNDLNSARNLAFSPRPQAVMTGKSFSGS